MQIINRSFQKNAFSLNKACHRLIRKKRSKQTGEIRFSLVFLNKNQVNPKLINGSFGSVKKLFLH